ncbi:MAG TPA: TetR/AcrR family transcriptional regulator [Steroidobacter sp.]|jgi:AcrR family transcriptional regulator|nr:TetR/AcrR family transcriptional regulator [Steroidobacter sp.]
MSYIVERRQEEKDRRRSDIVDAAEDLYRELGWDAVTMDSVAKRARLSRALVYVYFKDKRDLHFAIAQRALELLRNRFAEAAGRAKLGIDKVTALGRAYTAYGQEFPHYFDACARLELHVPDGAEATPQECTCIDVAQSLLEVVVEALRAGQRDGTIRADIGDPALTSRTLWGFMHGLMQIAITKSEPLARQGISVSQLTQHAVALIHYMLKAPKAEC